MWDRCLHKVFGEVLFSAGPVLRRRERNPQFFTEIELGVRDETAHIIDEGKEIAFSSFIIENHHRAVHGVTLPDIVWTLCLESSSVYGGGRLNVHETLLMKEAIYGREAEFCSRRDNPSSMGFSNDRADRSPLDLFSEAD